MTFAPSLSFQPVKAAGSAVAGAPLLSEKGPRVVLGWTENALAVPIAPDAGVLFGPRGACLHPNGSLWVSDTGHHRILGWHRTPNQDNAPADILIGQTDFSREGRNGKVDPHGASVNVPTGICAFRDGLAVADAWNHRVLIWLSLPTTQNQPADIVLGQADASGVLANRGADAPTASTLNWPYGVSEIDGRLFVSDTGNRRVLIWDEPTGNGQPADMVLGQTDFLTRDENSGVEVGQRGMRWPHAVVRWQGNLAVADAGNNRIMLWDGIPDSAGAPCVATLGQDSFAGCDHNMTSYYPDSKALNMPYALTVVGDTLIVGDTANSRLLGHQKKTMGAAATFLTGQPDFASKGDNRWGMAERDSLCWPYGLDSLGETVAIADSGNNRILIWDITS